MKNIVPVRNRFLSFLALFGLILISRPLHSQNLESEPRENPILFVGSSIFGKWTTLSSQMAPLPVENRAISGSRTADQLRIFDSVVAPIRPRVIVYYCGSNDIDQGIDAAVVEDHIHEFVSRVATDLPGTKMIFMSIIKSPRRIAHWEAMDAVNEKVRDSFTAEFPFLSYLEVNPIFFDQNGKPRMDLYIFDKLHLKPQAYVDLTAIIKPKLEELSEPAKNIVVSRDR